MDTEKHGLSAGSQGHSVLHDADMLIGESRLQSEKTGTLSPTLNDPEAQILEEQR
jgi:hypothetical protein